MASNEVGIHKNSGKKQNCEEIHIFILKTLNGTPLKFWSFYKCSALPPLPYWHLLNFQVLSAWDIFYNWSCEQISRREAERPQVWRRDLALLSRLSQCVEAAEDEEAGHLPGQLRARPSPAVQDSLEAGQAVWPQHPRRSTHNMGLSSDFAVSRDISRNLTVLLIYPLLLMTHNNASSKGVQVSTKVSLLLGKKKAFPGFD